MRRFKIGDKVRWKRYGLDADSHFLRDRGVPNNFEVISGIEYDDSLVLRFKNGKGLSERWHVNIKYIERIGAGGRKPPDFKPITITNGVISNDN